jgi:hypothetical protein
MRKAEGKITNGFTKVLTDKEKDTFSRRRLADRMIRNRQTQSKTERQAGRQERKAEGQITSDCDRNHGVAEFAAVRYQ